MMPALCVQAAHKQFGGLKAVDQVSFTLEAGALAALIGPNGAGKTTLFNLIAGALPLSSGAITFEGRRIRGPLAACRLGIARTFQNVRLFHEMSVLENVLVGMGTPNFLTASLRLPGQVQAERLRMKRAFYLLESVGMDGLAAARAGDPLWAAALVGDRPRAGAGAEAAAADEAGGGVQSHGRPPRWPHSSAASTTGKSPYRRWSMICAW